MAKWRKELYDPQVHKNMMKGKVDGQYQYNLDFSNKDNLNPQYVIIVEFSGFNFIFFNLRQLEVAIEYFAKKIKGSSMIAGVSELPITGKFTAGMRDCQKVFPVYQKEKKLKKLSKKPMDIFPVIQNTFQFFSDRYHFGMLDN